jgi:hypothetical protein
MSIKTRLIKLKQTLPLNGDWLYPTESPPQSSPDGDDLAVIYSETKEINAELKQTRSSVGHAPFLYEAERFAAKAAKRAEHVRDKAKSLLGTSTFIGAVVLGIMSFFAEHIASSSYKVLFPIGIFLMLMLLQFSRSLMCSIEVMTRETSIEISTADVITAFNEATDLDDYKRRLGIVLLATANQHEIEINKRVNKLILGQTGFKFGLFHTFVLILLLFVGIVYAPPKQQETIIKLAVEVTKAELQVKIADLESRLKDISLAISGNLDLLKLDLQTLTARIDSLAKRAKTSPPNTCPQVRKEGCCQAQKGTCRD